MDLWSIFRASPERQIRKLRKKVKQPHGDASVRRNAAQRLAEMATGPALDALLERFAIDVSPSSQDELEKEELFGWLTEIGREAVPPLIRFLKNQRFVYWPSRALREILEPEEFCREISRVLLFLWENPPATAVPKVEMIRSLGDLDSAELEKTIRIFLEDENDDVRLAAIQYLLARSEEEAREAVLECYLASDDRPRVRTQILEYFLEKGWSVRGYRPAVEETLPEGYNLTRDGKIRRVGA
jgi:HEAT repeat protein